MNILNRLSAIAKICTKEASRFAMNCIQVISQEKESRLIAATNEYLLIAKWEEDNKREFTTLVKGSDFSRWGKEAKTKKYKTFSVIKAADGDIYCTKEDHSHEKDVTVEGRFPLYEHTIPTYHESVTVTFSIRGLKKLIDAMDGMSESARIDFVIPKNEQYQPQPITLKMVDDDVEIAGVLMPLEKPVHSSFHRAI